MIAKLLRQAGFALGLSAVLATGAAWAQTAATPTTDASEMAMQAFGKEDYRQAMLLGSRALATTPNNLDLRLMVANSMSWTGRYEAAIEQYEKLFGTKLEAAARVGIGNIMRWRGLPHQAAPYLQQAVKLDPKDEEVRKAMALTQRDLRPSTTLRLGHFNDNQNYSRNELQVNNRFWNADRSMRFDVNGAFGREGAASPSGTRDLSGAVYIPGKTLSAKVDAAYMKDTRNKVYGKVALDYAGDVASLRLGRINWGRLANNQQALLDGMTATQMGGNWNLRSLAGDWKGRFDLYKVSDGNKVYDAETSFKPSWQPIPLGIFYQAGLFTRKADRGDPRYWSPDKAYSLLTLGLGKNWWGDKTDLSLMVQRGFAINSDSKSNLSVSGSGRYWVSPDSAVGFEFYASDSPRPSSYRSNYLGLSYQQLW